MKRNLKRKIAGAWRNVLRAFARLRSERKIEEQLIEKTRVAVGKDAVEAFDRACDTASSNGEFKPESGPKALLKADFSTKSAFDKTNRNKTTPKETQRVGNKEDNVCRNTFETTISDGANEEKTEGEPSRFVANAALKNGTQAATSQRVREWKNDKGKIVVQAALEVELSARSTEFVFLRTARGALYRYPLRRLSDADRVSVDETLDRNVVNKELGGVEAGKEKRLGDGVATEAAALDGETTKESGADKAVVGENGEDEALNDASDATCVSNELPGSKIEKERGENNALTNDEGGESETIGDFEPPRFCERETLLTLLKQEVSDCGDEGLRLDFLEDVEDDAASLSAAKTQRSSEERGKENDAASYDLRLSFWDEENDYPDESTSKKTLFDETAQLGKLNDLEDKRKEAQRARRTNGASARETETKKRDEKENDAQRKKKKKRKNLNSSAVAYYELLARMEPEELDGLLYDYCDNFDEIRDEIEAERIVDYYDWAYGDARYRNDGDERE